MSLSSSDLTELMELWLELNLTAADHGNLSQVETLVCSGAVSHAPFLHILSVLYVFIFLLGLSTNGLVLWVNLRSNRKHYETHLYVLNLAVADLCVVCTLPVWVTSLLRGGHWPFGDALCKLTHLIFSVNLFGSIFFLACMSADCYVSATLLTVAPGSCRRKLVRQLVCILVWLLALVASMPEAYFLQAVKSSHHDGIICRPVYPSANPREWMVGVQLSFIVLGFAIPFPVIATFYLLLAATVPPMSDQERFASRRIILAYILVFLACWLPFHATLVLDTLSLLHVLPFSCRLENFLDVTLHLTQCLSLVHCCVNPVLYNFLNRSCRNDLVKAFAFKYSTKTGLARLVQTSHVSEHSAATIMDSD